MKVNLIQYTGKGEGEWAAADLLLFTKQTRLTMSPGLLDDIRAWPEKKKIEELEYMSNTIQSSLEFSDYTFLIEDVTRAFTHQFVRTRQGSYAQQTMRILNVDGFGYETGPTIKGTDLQSDYELFMEECNLTYNDLIRAGASIEDARGVLPTNIHTNIVAKFNLRTLTEIAAKRSSPRTQGEYRDILNAMVDAVLVVHPWANLFLRNRKIDAAKELDAFINEVKESGYITDEEKTKTLKLVDMLRG